MPHKPSRIRGSAAESFLSKSLIPDTFSLAGTVWTVRRSPDLGELGRCERDKALILICEGIDEQIAESTFFHELMHAIRFTQGHVEHDERDIDAMGQLLHQYLLTRA